MLVSEPKAQPSHNQHALLMRGGGGYLDSPAMEARGPESEQACTYHSIISCPASQH